MLESVLGGVFSNVESLVSEVGPIGVFLAMFIETIFPPIPSEIVMPLAGYLAFAGGQGVAGLLLMVLAGTLGTTVGAVMIYFIAMYGGRDLVLRYGKRFMFDKKKMKTVDGWFEKHGSHAVFLCRMAPGLRELISIPAGLSRMNFPKFLVLTFAGSFIWSAFLGSVGYYLGVAVVEQTLGSALDIVALVAVLSLVIYFVFRHFRKSSGKGRS